MKSILLTNDDGCLSEGIMGLRSRLSRNFEVTIVAPDRERSAISMALTLNRPLRIESVREKIYAIDGTPADCINVAVQKILKRKPDFIISGMNLGENLSEDVLFSGTVGGAFAGFLYGIPSMAVSLIPDFQDPEKPFYDIEMAAEKTLNILNKLIPLGKIAVYNVNIPSMNNGKIVVTSLGRKRYKPEIIEKRDPRGKLYYWIGTGNPEYQGEKGSDIWAVKNHYTSVSVIQYDLNCGVDKKLLSGFFDEA